MWVKVRGGGGGGGGVVIFSHGTSLITCSNTSFSGDIDFSSLNDGTVSLTATITSASGNSKTSNPLNLVKNTGLPAINITSPISGTYINLSNESAFSVSGTCSENGELITFSHGASSITCSNTSFSGDIDFSSLTHGTVALTATITSASGNSKTSNPLNLVKNTELPTINITSPIGGTYINLNNQNAFRVSGTCSENGETIMFSQGTGSTTCLNQSFSGDIDFSSLNDGTVSLTATITSSSGNSKTSNPLNLVKNTELPTISITNPTSGTYINLNNQNAFRVSGTCSENGETIMFSQGTGSTTCLNQSFSGDIDFSSLNDGTISLTATITSSSGNSKTSSGLNLIKDIKPPTISIGDPSITTISSSNPVDFPITVSQSPSSINLQNSSVSLIGTITNCIVSVTNGTTINPSVRVSNCSAETGNIQIRIASGVAQDVAGNFSNVSNLSTAVAVQNFSGTPFKAKFSINSSDLNLNLNLSSSYTYNFIVHWGDGNSGIVTSSSDSDKNHTYSSEGVYTVTVTGRCPYLNFKGNLQIIEVTELGDTGWKSFNQMFYDANNLILVNGGVTTHVTNMDSMFRSATAANPDTSNWDTSNVTYMHYMFRSATAANPDTSNWDTSNVTHMQSMFHSAAAANPDTSNWDTSNVTSMNSMFSSATAANPDTSNWDTSNVTSMNSMFSSATAANPDTSNWDTSNVTSMDSMFSSAASFDQDISSWDTSNVIVCNSFSANTLASWTRAEKPTFTHCSPGY